MAEHFPHREFLGRAEHQSVSGKGAFTSATTVLLNTSGNTGLEGAAAFSSKLF